MKSKIGDLCESISITFDKRKSKVVLVNTSDVLNGKVINHEYVKNENLKGQFKKTFQTGDILYSEIRPKNRRFAFIDFCSEDYVASTKLMVLRAKKGINNQFLYQVLRSEKILDQLQMLAETRSGTFPQITFNELSAIKVSVPSESQQEAIVQIIGGIDNKIELNRQINHHLEQIVISIFDNTFPDVSSGDNTIGEYVVPKRGKGLLSKDALSGHVPVVAGGLQPSTYHNAANTVAPVITISASGANAGYVNLWHVPVWSSDSSFIDKSMTKDVYFWYIMLKKRQKEIYDSQTGSAQPHIYPKNIEVMPTITLSDELISSFTKQVAPIFEMIGNNLNEIKILEGTRDVLLPKLMSGEISITD